ncbi:ABC transporter permease [Telmatobacter sp. DSM 110680]|uniref:ABC transporter permease n=1 Tax=Telmatobacter sp. DSM 110680 TaxID=3036704 RepID=A0AAU7DEB9_9BACT
MLRESWSRIRFFFAGKKRAEVDEELQFHLEREVEANLAAGMEYAEARRRAMVSFGSRERARESCRQERPSFYIESLVRDLRYGIRGLWRNPGFTVMAVLTLALAIGANATIFSLIDQTLMQKLPAAHPEELVVLDFAGAQPGHLHSVGGNTPGHHHEFSYPMYRDLRDQNTALSGLIAESQLTLGVTWNNHAESVQAELVSGNYFETLGVRPAVGRLFVAGDETAPGANPVVVLSFDYWRTHLAGAPVAGKTLLVNGTPFAIAGVADPGFHSMVWGQMPAVFVPLSMEQVLTPEWPYLKDHGSYWIDLIGRLKPGGTRAQAEASLNMLFTSLRAAEFTQLGDQSAHAKQGFISNAHLNVTAGAKGFSPMRDSLETPLTIILAMVMLVMGMAVVNVASLLLVRAAARAREISVRYALGATNRQVLRQLLSEGMLLGFVGAAAGLALAPQIQRLLIHWISANAQGGVPFSSILNWHVLGFSLGVTVAVSLLFSLAPAMQFRNPRLAEFMQQRTGTSAGGSLRFRRTCVALQIGFSLLLMLAAGMFVRTIHNLRHAETGFPTDHLLVFDLDPLLAGYSGKPVASVEERALDAIAALPGVHAVGATNDQDLAGDDVQGEMLPVGYAGKPDEEFSVELPWVSTSYLQTLGVPLSAGRYFNAADTATSQRVAIVNESFAKHYFVEPQRALGNIVRRPNKVDTDATIVGVVADVKHASVRDPAIATCYTLFAQATRETGLTFYVRTWQPPDSAITSVRAAIAGIDTRLIVGNQRTMAQEIDATLLAERAISMLATAFGMLATLLAGIGLYGILAYSTAQRTREIGIRMALGAQRHAVVKLILRETLVLTGGAVAATIPLAILAARMVRSQLFGVSVADPAVYGAGILTICLVAALAGFIPARRAATVDPARALRTD